MTDNTQILVELFGTLKTSTDKNEDAIRQLIVQQLELVNHIKSLPIDDLKEAIKEHAKTSADDMSTCTDTVNTTATDTIKILHKVNSKLTKMLIALGLIVSIATGGYFIVRAVSDSDTIIERHLDQKFQELSDQITRERTEEIQKLRQEITELNKDGAMQ